MPSGFCPNCGHNLEADVPLELGPWTLEVGRTLFRGERMPISPQEANVLHTLAKARGRTVSAETIFARVSNGYCGPNLVSVVVCSLRKKLPEVPFRNERGLGYTWTASHSLSPNRSFSNGPL